MSTPHRQGWYGSPITEISHPQLWSYRVEPMTAIASMYVPSVGFMIGADGRCRSDDPADTRYDTDQAQKIFPIKNEDRALAFAVIGMGGTNNGKFVTVDEVTKAANTLANRRFTHASLYADRLSHALRRSLAKARREKRIPEFPPNDHAPIEHKNSIFRLILTGYFKREAWQFEIEFLHDEEDRVRSTIESVQLTQRTSIHPATSGSRIIEKALYEDHDPRFSRYTQFTGGTSLERAMEFVRGYIEACSDPLAVELDPMCTAIGGHIHIAEITQLGGFKWRIPPISQASSSLIVQT
jgi:hypothetical protein